MAERHIFDDHTTLVLRSLKGIVASHPTLSLIPTLKTVFNAAHDFNKVALISGGGAGHEPFPSGHVGRGLLSAGVSGDTLASPSARQVYGAIKAVPSKKGTILIITNYTGDNLHFGLACQQARADGLTNVGILPVGDDVSVGRTKGALVGRRALPGVVLVCKILGAAAEADWGYEETLNLGHGVTSALASIAATLGHCHVPGRAGYAHIPDDTIEIGLGVHNEPGMWVVSPQPKSKELITRMLKLILDQDDPERSFVPFEKVDNLILYVNNLGGMSTLEMFAIVDEALGVLAEWGYTAPVRTLCGTFETSLNASGFSLSILNLTHIARSSSTPVSVEQLLSFIDAPHSSASWPAGNVYPAPETLAKRSLEDKLVPDPHKKAEKIAESANAQKLKVSPSMLNAVLRAGAQAVLLSEPDLTRWDTIVGDGDCGETCAAGANAVLNAVDEGLGADGEVITVLRELTELIDETCGGTLGAIFSIFLAALTAEVRSLAATGASFVDAAFWGKASKTALETLYQSTAARVGHRTVMDALIPFVEVLASGGDFGAAADACRQGGEGTAKLVAKLGRATYCGEDRIDSQLPPDPGAMAVVALTRGMKSGLATR